MMMMMTMYTRGDSGEGEMVMVGDVDDTCVRICFASFSYSVSVGAFPSIPLCLSLESSAFQQLVWVQQLNGTPVKNLILYSRVIGFEQPEVIVSRWHVSNMRKQRYLKSISYVLRVSPPSAISRQTRMMRLSLYSCTTAALHILGFSSVSSSCDTPI
jgi:hypothetical protein